MGKIIKKEKRGGKREGAGRKPGEATDTISFRVKIKWIPTIKKLVKSELVRLEGSG